MLSEKTEHTTIKNTNQKAEIINTTECYT
jgi:hypothetical protein